MSEKGQEEDGRLRKDRTLSLWHGICSVMSTMKIRASLLWRKKAQTVSSALLLVGIAIAVFAPARKWRAASLQKTFFLAEPDLATPVFSSARLVQHLNATLHDYAEFAGYDQFCVRLGVGENMEIVSAARYSGAIFSLLNIEVVDAKKSDQAHVYISEKLWERTFSRDANAIGQVIRLNERPYVVAGITRSNHSPLAETDIWMPVRSRSVTGSLASMRIIGVPKTGPASACSQRKLIEFLRAAVSSDESNFGQTVGVIRLIPFESDIELLSAAMSRPRVIARRV